MKWRYSFRSPEYKAWASARNRCHNTRDPQFHRYGARGIVMCERWRNDFDAFVDDMGFRPENMTLERRDNNLGYSPANCIWTTPKAQSHNRRNNVKFGNRMLLDVAKEWGVEYHTLLARYHRGTIFDL